MVAGNCFAVEAGQEVFHVEYHVVEEMTVVLEFPTVDIHLILSQLCEYDLFLFPLQVDPLNIQMQMVGHHRVPLHSG
jgi:hypothetical protein